MQSEIPENLTKLLSRKDVQPICKQIASEHEGWVYAAEQFKNTRLKHSTLFIRPSWCMSLSAEPYVLMTNKTANKLYKQVFNQSWNSKEVFISFLNILEPGATQSNMVYSKIVYTLDEAEEYIRDFFARGLNMIEERYDYTDEAELIENSPFEERCDPFEYCFGRFVLHDFDFFYKLKANDLKNYKDGSLAPIFDPVPRGRFEEALDKVEPFVKQWEKNVTETGNLFGKSKR